MEVLLFIAVTALIVVPMWRLCERAGMKPAWSLVCIIPLGLIALLWYMAFGQARKV